MAAITLTTDSATIGTSEYFLASDSTTATYQTTDCILQVAIDTRALATGDEYEIQMYEKIDGSNVSKLIQPVRILGAQTKGWVSPSFIVGNGWEASVKKIAGTDRSIPWTIAKIS